MIGPYYNSRLTNIGMVISGNGFFEMACPHPSQQQEKKKKRTWHWKQNLLSESECVCFSWRRVCSSSWTPHRDSCFKQLESPGGVLRCECTEQTEAPTCRKQQHTAPVGKGSKGAELWYRKSWFFAGPQRHQEHGGGHAWYI